MSWVMVPVPEELAEEVQVLLMRLMFRANMPDWDLESLRAHADQLDDDALAVVTTVARASRTVGSVEAEDLTRSLGVGERELLGLVRELNETRITPAPPELVFVRPGPPRTLFMVENTAWAVAELEDSGRWPGGRRRG
jgi:hypothetical protein